MDFYRLRIINFLTIGDSGDIFLTDRGLNLLQGVNDDDTSASSNGAGKSTIADALCWVLYGETARGESGDAIVNDKVGKDCMVELTMIDGSSTYTVRRYRKHKQGKNELHLAVDAGAAGDHDLTKGTTAETQAEIVRILGSTLDVFKASIYAGQGDMVDLPALKDKALKVLVEQAAGVERLERAYEIARQQANDLAREAESVNASSVRLEAAIRDTLVAIETAKLKHKEFEDGREERAKQYEAASALEKGKAATMVEALKRFDEPKLRADLETHQASVKQIQQLQATASSYERGIVKPAEQALQTAQVELKFLTEQAILLRKQHDEAEQQVGKPCQMCAKPHTLEDVATVRAHLKDKLVDAVSKAKKEQEKVAGLQDKLVELRTEHQRLVDAVPNAANLMAEIGVINTKLLEAGKIKADARTFIANAQNLLQQATAARSEVNPHKSVLDHLDAKLDADTRAKDVARTKLEQLRAELEDAQAVVEVFGPAGVRAHILDTVTPFLNDRTADYLGTLSDGNMTAVWSTLSRLKSGEIREKFAIEVSNTKGGKSYKLISGGEKKKVQLACMWALNDLTASRAIKPINLWIGDEVDDAVDPPGLERLMTILERKAREKGTVIVISHNSLSDWIDNVTHVKKPLGKSSVVEGALCEPA
jgi:DNA repair exonuclease SbcCD ATPase subunit